MTSVPVLKFCVLSACSNTLLLRNDINKVLVAANRRSTAAVGRQHRHHRRHNSYTRTLASPHRRRRTALFAYWPSPLQKPLRSFPHILSKRRKEAPRRSRSMVDLHNSIEAIMLAQTTAQHDGNTNALHISEGPPPPSPAVSSVTAAEPVLETRSTRSESVTSRSSNRLSLTIPIPIALPTAPSSRPTPTSSNMASYPATPLDTPSLMSPVDSNDFITAIAAQERRVLELREELLRAESDLHKLKRQWTSSEAQKKHAQIRNAEPLRPLGPHTDTLDDPTTRRSVELDRRKQLLLGQQSQQGTPTNQHRRRVFRGGHTRTLSLLSPTKPSGDGFYVHEDTTPNRPETWKPALQEIESPSGSGYITIYPTPSKRASWAPRSVHQQTSGVKQIAEDLKTGLWTFMEDLRQATVGDEPITGHGSYLRGIDGNMRSTAAPLERDESKEETIRACASSAAGRPHASSLFDYTDQDTPTPASRFVSMTDEDDREKENSSDRLGAFRQPSSASQKISALSSAGKNKRFSWTPLTMDSYNDDDWSNWESPSASVVKPPSRWSGSTVNTEMVTDSGTRSGGTISSSSSAHVKQTPSPKKNGRNLTTTTPIASSNMAPATPSSASSYTTNKLEDLLPPVLNRLTPSNLKKSASDFMREWERSLSSPPAERQHSSSQSEGEAAQPEPAAA